MPLIVIVDKAGHITLDNKPVTLDEASDLMKQHMADNANAAVMDMLKPAGVKRLAIAAKQKG